jgi:predicted nuclease of restriction endonuclease-like RecB superfamily
MLTKAHRVYHWDRRSNSISSDRLEDFCLPHLARGIAVYRSKIGAALGDVRNAARAALEGLRPDRVEGVIDLLDDAATYEWPRGTAQATRRVRVFAEAAAAHPVLDQEVRRSLLGAAFGPVAEKPDETVAGLYADYPEFHRLVAFPRDYSPEELCRDYDLAQAQALLYDASRIEVEAHRDFKHIVQYARLSRLLHRIERAAGGGYRLLFDGPNSVLRRTHAYGVDFAKFLAALVQVQDWRLSAEIALRKKALPFRFVLSSSDGLRSRIPPPRLFDSGLEEAFARKFGAVRRGWRLHRETMLLEAGERLVVPDFVFVHEDGTEVVLEIVGYWTPEYLAEKFEKLARITGVNLVVAVRKQWALRGGDPPPGPLLFNTRILLRDLMPRLEIFRGHFAGR